LAAGALPLPLPTLFHALQTREFHAHEDRIISTHSF
jgi:hypothetical protein